MTPSLAPGDLVLVRPPRGGLPSVGSIVLLEAPEDDGRVMIKRVASCGAETFAVRSDNPSVARDSRQFGSLSGEHWLGTATLVFSRDGTLTPLSAGQKHEASFGE